MKKERIRTANALKNEHLKKVKDACNEAQTQLREVVVAKDAENAKLRHQVNTLLQQFTGKEEQVRRAYGWAAELGVMNEHVPIQLPHFAGIQPQRQRDTQNQTQAFSTTTNPINKPNLLLSADPTTLCNNSRLRRFHHTETIASSLTAQLKRCIEEGQFYHNKVVELSWALENDDPAHLVRINN